jgi:hypothetical protein
VQNRLFKVDTRWGRTFVQAMRYVSRNPSSGNLSRLGIATEEIPKVSGCLRHTLGAPKAVRLVVVFD